jgi:hypothetical protein
MKYPVVLAWVVGLLFVRPAALAETCLYEDLPPSGQTILVLTKRQMLAPSSAHTAHVGAASLTGPRFNGTRRYLVFSFILAFYYETEDEAMTHLAPEGIPVDSPLVITLANGDSITLHSWGHSRGSIGHAEPGGILNATDQFRVTAMTHGKYWVDEATIAALKNQPAVRLAVSTESGNYVIHIDPQATDRIQFVLGCV